MDLQTYDVILVNSSAGKDSQAMLDYVVELADRQGVRDRLLVVHADLGRVEWAGTRELAERQAAHYGLRFVVVSRPQGDLLTHVEQRGLWPSSKARYCTSDHKRGQVAKVITAEADAARRRGVRIPRILNCLGLRSQESSARAKCSACKARKAKIADCAVCGGSGRRQAFTADPKRSNAARVVHDWLPILDWSLEEVWSRIKASGVEHHRAYDLGMPRLSCCFCIFAPKAALTLAGRHNPGLLAEYAAVEVRIGHKFRENLSIADVKRDIDAGAVVDAIPDWSM